MKIGFVLDDSLDKPDGVQQYIMTLGAWLVSRGHEVHYLAGESNRADLKSVHSLSRNVGVRFNQNRMSIPLPASTTKIKELLGKLKLDVLHVQMPYSPMLGAKVIKQASPATAVVGTFHIVPYSDFERYATRLLRLWLHRTLARFDGVISVSPAAKLFAKESLGLSSEVLPNVVNVASLSKGKALESLKDDKTNIVFLGRLVERKGSLQLLEAADILNQQGKLEKLRILICGTGPLERRLRRFIAAKGLASNVQFLGFVDEQEKADYLASADIAIFPSLGGESFGIVLIEAIAAGAGMVLGGDNPGYQNVLEEASVLFNAAQPREIAAKLSEYAESRSKRQAVHHKQQEILKRYDVQTVGPRIEAFYQDAIAKRKGY